MPPISKASEAHRWLEERIRRKCRYAGHLAIIRLDHAPFPGSADVTYSTRVSDYAGRAHQRVPVPGLVQGMSVYDGESLEAIAHGWSCDALSRLTPGGRDVQLRELYTKRRTEPNPPAVRSAPSARGDDVYQRFQYDGKVYEIPLPENYEPAAIPAYIDRYLELNRIE